MSSLPNDSNRHDTVNYSRYYLKRMSAEELMDAIVQVTGVEERFTGWAPVRAQCSFRTAPLPSC